MRSLQDSSTNIAALGERAERPRGPPPSPRSCFTDKAIHLHQSCTVSQLCPCLATDLMDPGPTCRLTSPYPWRFLMGWLCSSWPWWKNLRISAGEALPCLPNCKPWLAAPLPLQSSLPLLPLEKHCFPN